MACSRCAIGRSHRRRHSDLQASGDASPARRGGGGPDHRLNVESHYEPETEKGEGTVKYTAEDASSESAEVKVKVLIDNSPQLVDGLGVRAARRGQDVAGLGGN